MSSEKIKHKFTQRVFEFDGFRVVRPDSVRRMRFGLFFFYSFFLLLLFTYPSLKTVVTTHSHSCFDLAGGREVAKQLTSGVRSPPSGCAARCGRRSPSQCGHHNPAHARKFAIHSAANETDADRKRDLFWNRRRTGPQAAADFQHFLGWGGDPEL